MFETSSKLKKRHQKDISDVMMLFLLSTSKRFYKFSGVSTVAFEQVNSGWERSQFTPALSLLNHY